MSISHIQFEVLKREANRRAKTEQIPPKLMRDMVARENGYSDWGTMARLTTSPLRELASNEAPGT